MIGHHHNNEEIEQPALAKIPMDPVVATLEYANVLTKTVTLDFVDTIFLRLYLLVQMTCML